MHESPSPSPTPEAFARLRGLWLAFVARVGTTHIETTDADALFFAIESLYANPLRAYHNLAHIAACLDVLDTYRHLAIQPDAIELALWLHDCVYVAGRADNESRSATIAAMFARELGFAPHAIADITAWIIATKHVLPPATADEALLLDIDMAILASPAEQYDAYTRAIRAEFAYASDEQFCAGRAAFVRELLERPRIFHVAQLHDALEGAARENLARELKRR